MRIVTTLFGLWLWAPFPTMAIPYPVITSAKITSCKDTIQYDCSRDVDYSGTTEIMDITPSMPAPIDLVRIKSVGVHCHRGDGARGIPFTGCTWVDRDHSPALSNCDVVKGTWDLKRGSTCAAASTWGYHAGAGPGGECVMFGYTNSSNAANVITPYGSFTAVQAANGGNRFCIKPLPPGVTCQVSLPSLIDHGTVAVGDINTKYIQGVVNCGRNPIVEIVGSPSVTLGPGVSTTISTTMSSSTALRIQSNLRVGTSVTPGDYSASIIVAVSPY